MFISFFSLNSAMMLLLNACSPVLFLLFFRYPAWGVHSATGHAPVLPDPEGRQLPQDDLLKRVDDRVSRLLSALETLPKHR
jgi:hypothetical protein